MLTTPTNSQRQAQKLIPSRQVSKSRHLQTKARVKVPTERGKMGCHVPMAVMESEMRGEEGRTPLTAQKRRQDLLNCPRRSSGAIALKQLRSARQGAGEGPKTDSATIAPLDFDESWAPTIGGSCAVGRLAGCTVCRVNGSARGAKCEEEHRRVGRIAFLHDCRFDPQTPSPAMPTNARLEFRSPSSRTLATIGEQ
jgi:hypothetical protein